MAEVAATPENAERFRSINSHRVKWLEQEIDNLSEIVSLPNDFIIPGDTIAGAALSIARAAGVPLYYIGTGEDPLVLRVARGEKVELRERDDRAVRGVHLLLDLVPEPGQDRHHAHEHRDPDRDPQDHESRAQLVRQHDVDRKAERFPQELCAGGAPSADPVTHDAAPPPDRVGPPDSRDRARRRSRRRT